MVFPAVVLLLSVVAGVLAGRMRQRNERLSADRLWADNPTGGGDGELIVAVDRVRMLELCQVESAVTTLPGQTRARDLRLDLMQIDRQIESTLRDLEVAERQLNTT